MTAIKRLLFSALPALLLGGTAVHAAEFEVLDRFSVDGYSVLRGSADIPGGSFSVGGSAFVVKDGNVGIGTTAPAASLNVVGTNTVPVAFKVQTGSISGTEVVVSTSGDLNVSGKVKVGNSASVCTSDAAGTLRWAGGHMSVCNGSEWRQLDNQPPPTISVISPAAGPLSGGTAITLSGSGFVDSLVVLVGGVAATVTAVTGSQIHATTPASSSTGRKEVVLTNPDGQNCAGEFTYNPTITAVTPASGIVGADITIAGDGFNTGAGLTIGDVEATSVVRVSATQITAKAPSSSTSGAKSVKVTNLDATSGTLADGFTYKVYAAGGVISGGYRVHTFLTTGAITFTTGGDVEVLVVAGGGGGGGGEGNPAGDAPGGGGAGGYRTATLTVAAQAYPVTVGAGGAGATGSSLDGTKGQDSVFSSITAAGGGFGAREESTGGPGGSGGGAGGSCGTGDKVGGAGNTPATTPVQGYAGGFGTDAACAYRSGAGGGGSGGVGGNNLSNGGGGAGGAGTVSSITGASYAGGGGGGTGRNAGNLGGAGQAGGGKGGSSPSGAGGAATAITGSGGGGAGSGTPVGGSGGSGIVVIRYPN